MTVKIAINGFGRIGRNIVRALYESGKGSLKIVAINDLSDVNTNAHLYNYDSTFGIAKHQATAYDDRLVINGDQIKICAERDPRNLPWKELGVDLVLECTGIFASKDKAAMHLEAGAKKVLISAPAGKDLPTIVYGVNHETLKPSDLIVSNASCTTNCLSPIVKPLHDTLGIESGLMTTVHAFTNDQVLCDVSHSDLRRARGAANSMIPTKTGAAAAVGLVLPELDGKLDGLAVRVPLINVSLVDLNFVASRETSVDEVNTIIANAADNKVLSINEKPLVSIDFNKNSSSSIFDMTQTKVKGNLVKVMSWYDNEWGFSNRMLDTAEVMASM